MEPIDEALCRAWNLSLEDWSDAVEDALEEVLPALIQAGYVAESGRSLTGSFWTFTQTGTKRLEELGCG
jgi:hypothetical protein